MKKILSFLLFSIVFLISYSQNNTAYQWYFGVNAGLDFSTGVPTALTGGALNTGEGCATVGDVDGNLLFYTDGQNVYNVNHQIMQNGAGLMGHMSATQSSIIIPLPESDSLFYIFTVDAGEHHLQNGLRYSIVDMSLDGGLGAVTSVKNVLLEGPVTEKQTAILHQDDVNVWLLAHRWNSNEFIAYLITPAGLSTTPVISAIGSVHQGGYSSSSYYNGWTNSAGYMKANITGSKIALAIHRMHKYELFDFNNLTGTVSNYNVSPATFTDAYGVEFSPDGTKLYATMVTGASNLYQFDITQTNPFDNPVLIATPPYQPSGMQIAPNGKIYVASAQSNYISVINNPNSSGLNCDFQEQAIYLEGAMCKRGLPSIFFYKGIEFFTGSNQSITICEGDSVLLESSFQTVSGNYTDTLFSVNGWDSLINTSLTVIPTPLPVISENANILTCNFNNAISYQWYFDGNLLAGETNQTYEPQANGIYQVEVEDINGCTGISDNFYFEFIGIEEMVLNKCIYPNPFRNNLIIELNGYYSVLITDVNGRNIFYKNNLSNSNIINLKQFKQGLYFIKITSDKRTIVKKIIKVDE